MDGSKEKSKTSLEKMPGNRHSRESENHHYENTSITTGSGKDFQWLLSPLGMLLGNRTGENVIPQTIY